MNPLPGRLVLLGHPVSHSLSPAFQNAALRAAGIPLVYEALDVPPGALDAVLPLLREARAAGNVTVPHKTAFAARCDELTGVASRVGAVNTFYHAGSALVGENTDVDGFRAMATAMLGDAPRGLRVALLGAGGAAAAACAVIEEWEGCRVVAYARGLERLEALMARFPGLVTAAPTPAAAARDADVVVNTTPVGLRDAAMPMALEDLPRDAAVMDLAYRAGETPWVRAARAAGHRAADGLDMLLEQGAVAFERWFGIAPDRTVMRRSLAA
jgi:shikimate dehydrogenase